ncbi:MAG: hypothetical protein KIS78_08210 [Labilithrix sp.]|nr:hypothetical protein [Labilithrix sp.]MCW5832406.1 hypothetical protein [Labilithrix sp.]
MSSIERVEADVYVVPTEQPESDATLTWERTSVVVVRVFAGGDEGLGWTFADASAAELAAGPAGPRPEEGIVRRRRRERRGSMIRASLAVGGILAAAALALLARRWVRRRRA